MSSPLAIRFGELALALAGAKDRLRSAVAEELGRAAGSAIRDILTDASQLSVRRPNHSNRDSWADERRWDERDPWEDDRSAYRDRYEDDESTEEQRDLHPAGVPPAVVVGLGLWRWWLGRSGSQRGAMTLGLIAGVTTLLGGPVVRAALATLAAAAELLSPWPLAVDTRLGSR